MAPIALFMAGAGARYVTAQTIHVNGGLELRGRDMKAIEP